MLNTTPLFTPGVDNKTQKSFLRLVSVVVCGLLCCVFLLILLNPTLVSIAPISNMITPGFFGVAHASPLLGLTNDQNSPTAGPDLTITKTHVTHFINGNQGTYAITVKNVGDITVTGIITVIDKLPGNLTYLGSIWNGWQITPSGKTILFTYWNTNSLSAGALLPPLNIVVTVAPTNTTIVTNTVSVANVNDLNISNNQSKNPTNISADLAVNKTVKPNNPAHGNVITFTLAVTNTGPNDTSGVVLTDTIPAKMTYIGFKTTSGIYTQSNGRWVIGNLSLNQAVSLIITGTVNSAACGSLVNSTRGLTSNLPDGNPSNNSSSVSVAITCLDGLVTDAGKGTPINAAVVSMKDSANHTFPSQTTNASGWYTFTDTPTQLIASGTVTLTVTKTGYRTKTVTASVTAGIVNHKDIQLENISDLAVTKTDNKTTVIPGETFTYTIGVTNTGTLTATTVVMTDVWSSQLTYLLDSLRGQTGVISKTIDHTRVWTLTNGLHPGEGKIFALEARVANPLASGTTAVTNTVRARTSAIEDNTSNNSDTDVDYTPNVNITKSVSPTEGKVNTRFTFSILVKNNAKASMTNVVLNDVFPSYLTYYSGATTKGSYSYNTSTRTFSANIGTLLPGESATITIYMTVNSTTTTTQILYDTATLTYSHGGSGLTATSNTISYRILGSTSLPGTGGFPAEIAEQNRSAAGAVWVALICSILLCLGGLFSLRFGLKNRGSQWSSWALKTGSLLIFIGLLFGAVAWGVRFYSSKPPSGQQVFVVSPTPLVEVSPTVPVLLPSGDTVYAFQDHQTLPNYPVPTPTASTAPGTGQPQDSTSPVRLLVPSLGIDAVVKYVPFDGFSWLISGLQNEIAWMGDTSWPGLGGNTALAGHVTLRNGADGPFRYLEKLKSGDEIAVFTEKNVYRYQVRELKTVPDSDMSVTKPTQETILTLITCTGWDTALGHYLERLIVLANLVEVRPLAASGY